MFKYITYLVFKTAGQLSGVSGHFRKQLAVVLLELTILKPQSLVLKRFNRFSVQTFNLCLFKNS